MIFLPHSYTVYFVDAPDGSSLITYCWNAIAKSVAFGSVIDTPALIGGFRIYSLLDSQAMLDTQYCWYAVGLRMIQRADSTSITDALHITTPSTLNIRLVRVPLVHLTFVMLRALPGLTISERIAVE